MVKKYFLIIFISGLLFPQIIDHESQKDIFANTPLVLEVYCDYPDENIISFNIFYRTNQDQVFMLDQLNKLSMNTFGYTISSEFVNNQYVEYYFLLETSNDNFISLPEVSPNENPYIVRVENSINENNSIISYLNADYEIISPQDNEKKLNEELIISLSYYKMGNLDLNATKLYIDDIDFTTKAVIRSSNIILIPNKKLSKGKHSIKINLSSKDGVNYNPIIWSFYILSDFDKNRNILFSGKIWNDYNNNSIDNIATSTNTSNLNLNFQSDWIDANLKVKKSSLESDLMQAKDRYSLNLKLSKSVNINVGDFYPSQNDFFIKGYRVRGIGLDFDSKFFQLNLINGELARSIQGSPSNSIVISDYYSEYICDDPSCTSGYNSNVLDLSRSGYSFKRDLLGLRLGIGRKDRLNFGLNILKAKDDISSVDKNVSNAVVTLPYNMEVFDDFNSDQFVDLNHNDLYDSGEPLYRDNDGNALIDYNNNTTVDDVYVNITDITSTGYDISFLSSDPVRTTIENFFTMDDCSIYGSLPECIEGETYSAIQYVWVMEVAYNNLDSALLNSGNYNNLDTINFSDKQWDGEKPKDNLVIGTDFSYTSRNSNLKVKSSIALSLYNENIWDGGITNSQLDAFDGYEDCYIGRTYDFATHYPALDSDCLEISCENGITIVELSNDAVCSSQDISGVNIDVAVEEPGFSISNLPDLEDYSDYFMFTVDNIPFPSIIDKLSKEEDFEIKDFLDSPDISYSLDFSLRANKNNNLNFGLKKVGESFYSLANPYLQKDVYEEYVTNRIRLFQNRLFLTLKWARSKNGLLDNISPETQKKDISISYYPGIDLPSISLSKSRHHRTSGDKSEGYELFDAYGNVTGVEGEYDSRLNTINNSYNLSITHGFDLFYKQKLTFNYFTSEKEDRLFDEFINYQLEYISPQSESDNFSLNLKTKYNYNWDSYFQLSRSYFNYAQFASSFYQEQTINSISTGFSYSTDYFIDRLGARMNFSKGIGSNQYSQFGLSFFTNFIFRNNMTLNLSYNYKDKDNKNDEDYNNSLFKANLSYSF